MTRPKKVSTKASEASVKSPKKQPDQPANKFVGLKRAIYRRITDFMNRRPHRSFRMGRHRDYARSMKIPGYFLLTRDAWRLLWKHKWTFILLGVLYAALSAALVGLASQSTYSELQDSFSDPETNPFQGNFAELGKAGVLLLSGITGSLNETPTDVQRIFAALLGLLVWLTTIWLLRTIIAGKKPKLRDGLYNAGTPLVSTFFVSLVVVIQLLPVALAALAFGAAASTGLITGGVESMLFWTFAALLGTLSLYWIVGTFFALIVITLPGIYPMRALKIAGDLVVGRRMRIVLRFLWMLLMLVVSWAVILIPIIFLDKWLKSILPAIQWLPLVPVALLLVASFSVVWAATYTYVFYRKVVDDDSAPA